MRIHALASTRQYRRHVDAVWKHIDPSLRGTFVTGRGATTKRLPPDDVVMVGGYYDLAAVPQRMVYVEHGAGQSYPGEGRAHPCYHGASHPARVIGYISPSQRVADAWSRPAFAAGCPALDWAVGEQTKRRVAAITFHFDARGVSPEAWSARPHWEEDIHNMVSLLRNVGFEVIGTWHPRDPVGHKVWRNIGIEGVADPDQVLERCGLLIGDNTSLMYEAAHIGRAVVALNAPWYRRDIDHGLRFWDHVPGAMADDISEFAALNFPSYVWDVKTRLMARSAAEYAYALRPGTAGPQAARWVEKLVTGEV